MLEVAQLGFLDSLRGPYLTLLTVCIGFVVGLAVAATGIGGGILLTPLLTVVLRISPMGAVGIALSFMSATKLFAVHSRRKTVDFRLAAHLALGSVPGAILGATVLAFAYSRLGRGLNTFVRPAIAASLIIVAILSLILERQKDASLDTKNLGQRASHGEAVKAVGIGFLGGLLVTATSVGSGSLIILLLLLFCPRAPAVLVGTDILHALILTTIAALLYLRMNVIDFRVVGLLLCGGLPGVIIGTRVSVALAAGRLRKWILILALVGGLAMFWRD